MKKFLALFFFLPLFYFPVKAQDSMTNNEFHVGFGISNAGMSLNNRIGNTFNFDNKGMIIKTSNAGFAINSKKIGLELGFDIGRKSNLEDNNRYTLDMSLSNYRFAFKYRPLSTPKSDLALLTDFNAQLLKFTIDSTSVNSKLFDLNSTTISKDLVSLGLGIEYIYKCRIQKHRSLIFGARAAYNLYVSQNLWAKGNYYKDAYPDYSNKDLGYFHAQLFFGYRFYRRGI